MKKLESLKNNLYKLTESDLKKIVGGAKDEEGTEIRDEISTEPSNACPCGDVKYHVTFDGIWAETKQPYCTTSECIPCFA